MIEVLQFPAVAACAVAVIILTSAIKSIVKWKKIFVWLPVLFSLPFGIIVAFTETGFTLELIKSSITYWVSIFMTAITSYDVVYKTIQQFAEKKSDT